jgi:serralysin
MCGFCGQAAFQHDNFSAASGGNPFAANGEAFNTRTGDNNIDGVLIGTRWSSSALTFAFPTNNTYYTQPYEVYLDNSNNPVIDNSYVTGFSAFNASYQAATRTILQSYANVTNVTFTEVGSTTQADLAFAMTNTANLPTADARFPNYTANEGHQWYNINNYAATATLGSYTYVTIIHETGHTMGLAHGHSPDSITSVAGVVMSTDRDSMEFSIMTYRGFIGAPITGYQNEEFGYAQTLMMYDIAALQFLYGADYVTNAGANVYTFSSTTGQMFLDGVGQGTPGANRIFRTVWDGGGVDTYDLSNYNTNLDIDLTPGGWSTFDTAQLANLGSGNFARANLFNALLFNGDLRSLIENATGGSGNDTIEGNRGGNTLIGNAGTDTLIGGGGGDVLFGGADADFLYGDATPSGAGIGFGSGLHVHSNIYDTTGAAFNFTNLFSLSSNANIGNSTTIPHVTLRYSDVSAGQNQFYAITLTAGTVLTLDIDGASFDTIIRLLNSVGGQIAFNDDASGDQGSTITTDSFLTYTITTTGTYYIEIDAYNITGLPANAAYDLHVSVDIAVRGDDGVAGADFLLGGEGADQLFGGAGNDSLYGGSGADLLDGGADFDLARYDDATAGVYARLDGLAGSYGDAAGDTFTGIEGLVGSYYADILVGNNVNGDSLYGSLGADTLYGLGGSDTLDGHIRRLRAA